MPMLLFMGRIAVGGILGALIASIATPLWDTATDSPLTHDGQYFMICLATGPLGWAFGAAAAVRLAQRAGIQPRRAVLATMLLILVGAVVVGPFLGIAGMWAFSILWRLHG